MAAITCQVGQSPALFLLSEAGEGREYSSEERGYSKGCVGGGACHREISTRSKEFVVDSKEEGKGDVGNSS